MADRTETFLVEHSLPGERFDAFLRARYPAVSRGQLQRLIVLGHIRVNGQPVKPTHHPRAGEQVEVFFPEARPAEARPEAIPLDVLYEDADLLVLNKPPGIVTHPGPGNEEHTLVNALLHHCQGGLSGIGGVERPGIVHRLDKDTSGCLVVAKNDETHAGLAAQFAGRTMEKIYLAILCGEVPRAAGEIRAAIARHPSHRKSMIALDGGERGGRDSWTSYVVRERLRGSTLVQATLHTGRTHQIRVHFQHLGFPLVGDDTYAKRQNARLAELTGFRAARQMLHARHLTFTHPRTERLHTFTAPCPEDFQRALETLRPAAPR